MCNTAFAPADVIRRYFDLDSNRDIESIVALFSDEAIVVDEGETRHGTEEIRAWQVGPASKYTYTTEVLGTVALEADRYVVTGRLAGNFPGGSAVLTWDFTVAGGRISRLVIEP
jgi:ketosteroid isomerase-like protein